MSCCQCHAVSMTFNVMLSPVTESRRPSIGTQPGSCGTQSTQTISSSLMLVAKLLSPAIGKMLQQ